MKTTTISVGEAPLDVYAQVTLAGSDLIVAIGGGPAPHIGATAVGVPRVLKYDQINRTASVSVYTVTGHREDEVARPVAMRLASRFNHTVAVTCGIHLDNATREQVLTYVSRSNELVDAIEAWVVAEQFADTGVNEATQRADWSVDEDVIAINEIGTEVGVVSRAQAHSGEGVLHHAFATFLVGSVGADRGKVMIARRSARKRLWARAWGDSCAGHPKFGENIVSAGERRVREELGVDVSLEDTGSFIYREPYGDAGIEYELCHVLVGVAPEELELNEFEVEEVRFVSPAGLAVLSDNPPTDFAPWLVAGLRHLGLEGLEALSARVGGLAPVKKPIHSKRM
jgi:isopentenyl-diphosphate delta-isomerase